MNEEEILFEEAAALPAEERAAYLDAACAGNPEMRARLDGLLRSHEASGFMEDRTAAPFPLAASSHAHVPAEEFGTVIGRYKLLQEIGEGGFGVVWMAEQEEPVRRRVALKIIKAGMDTCEVIARFEAERQALAMMHHPNIAQIFDAGETPTGRPFIVMELVHGHPITQSCDEKTFTARQRLELFLDVCSAVGHAHQKGIIHRDIKPSNVMVTMDGDKPLPKVIDFGIAKATQGRLADRTFFTRFEQFVGTPAYTSPEQAVMGGLDVDTRSDIYSLGVLLYELLTGKPPFETMSLLSAGYDEMRRIIREVEPSRPSARLAIVAGEERTQVAVARQVTPEKLDRLVEPDLDWIVMKAIEKDPVRRYETINALALDVSHFLSGETVSAMPPSTAYRLRKFARRHRFALRAAGAFAAMLVATTAVSTWLAVRATKAEKYAVEKAAGEAAARIEAETERARAEAARVEAEGMTTFLFNVFANAQPASGGPDLNVTDSLHNALQKLKTDLTAHPVRRYRLQQSIIRVLHTYGLTDLILPYAEECRDFFMRTSPPDHPDTLDAQFYLATYYMDKERWKEAKDVLERLHASEKHLFSQEHPDAPRIGDTMGSLALCCQALGLTEEARALREKRLAFCRRRGLDDSHLEMMQAKEDMAGSLFVEQRWVEALKLREEVILFRFQSHMAARPEPLVSSLADLAMSYESVGREDEARTMRMEIQRIRQNPPQSSGALAMANARRKAREEIQGLLKTRRFDEAVEMGREFISLPGVIHGVGNDVEPECLLANALLLRAKSDWGKRDSELAAKAIGEADELIRLSESRGSTLATRAARVDFFMSYGHWDQAAALGASFYESASGNPWAAYRYGPLLLKTGQMDAYEDLCRELLLPFTNAGPDQLDALYESMQERYTGVAFDIIARVVCLRAPEEEHLKWASALAGRAAALEDDPRRDRFLMGQGLVNYRAGKYPEVIEVIEPLLPALTRRGGAVGEISGLTVLAMARYRLTETAAARTALRRAWELYEASWFSDATVAIDGIPYDWLLLDLLLHEAKSLIHPEE